MVVDKALCIKMGVNSAIVLEGLKRLSGAYKCLKEMVPEEHVSREWLKLSHKDIMDFVEVLSKEQIRSALRKLEDEHYIESTREFNEHPMDKVKWWRINES